jgi:hypothetical protein
VAKRRRQGLGGDINTHTQPVLNCTPSLSLSIYEGAYGTPTKLKPAPVKSGDKPVSQKSCTMWATVCPLSG